MRRNVFITEFVLPIVVAAAMILPIFVIERLVFGWSKEALGVTEILGGGLFVFVWTPIGSWLAPRIGLPPPTGIGKSRRDLYR
jgi:hypothetical protein